MSLFPAYSDTADTKDNPDENKSNTADWLALSSFKLNISESKASTSNNTQVTKRAIHRTSTESESSDVHSRKCKKKRHKKSHKRHKTDKTEEKIDMSLNTSFKNEDFIIDKTAQRVFLKVQTISRPSVSKYDKYSYSVIGDLKRHRERKKVERYYNTKYIPDSKNDKETEKIQQMDKILEENEQKPPENKDEESITQKTAFYNQTLGKDPFDVDMWLEYVRFQDTVCLFERTYRKGSMAKGGRVTAERKLSILDKALTHNPNNEILSRERVLIAERVYPADELNKYLKNLVEKDPSNIILWQGYIEATQCSMAHCTTPVVVEMYNRCLTKLHQLRRNSVLEKSLLEERILCMLYQCGLFLRQAGLWEQLWTLLRLYLELNLSSGDKNKFNLSSKLNDKELIELEEATLESQLPLHELWLRVEKLRESCHWLPWLSTEPTEDPQRVVFIEDVSDLIHPITSTGNSFRLTVTILTLLKTPLLPCRHSTMEELGLDYVPWALDTIESIYPVFFPIYPVDLTNNYLLKDAVKLVVGPQYLKTHPGQEEYLDFLVNVMRNSADNLDGVEKNSIYVWWLRFERLLIVLDKENRFKMPKDRKKKVKSSVKDFLKDEAHRNNVVFYKEYALIEYELGNFENATKILLTAISMQNGNPITAILNETDRAGVSSLYRTLIELHLNETNDIETNRKKATEYLITLINGSLDKPITPDVINETIEKYKHITTELLNAPQNSLTVAEHFLPDYMTDMLICYGWLLYLTRTSFEAGSMIENASRIMEDSANDVPWRRELLMEWYVSMFYKTCTEQLGSGIFGLFSDILHKSLSLFPNNLFLLTVACKEQSTSGCVGKPWWKLSNLLANSGHAMPTLFIIIIANQSLSKLEEDWTNATIDTPVISPNIFKNRMLSLFARLTNSDICTKRCGLLWRLYLQFLYSYSDPDNCRKAYYAAVEECPWLKALYIDAAIYIPAELPQIQDLIIEKQLRIHVTPEELDELRS